MEIDGLTEPKIVAIPAVCLSDNDGNRFVVFTAAEAEKIRLHCEDLANRVHKAEAENALLLEANRKLSTSSNYQRAGSVPDQPVAWVGSTAEAVFASFQKEVARQQETIAGLTNRVKSVCAERDQLNAECHRVTAIGERKILQVHSLDVANSELRRRNTALIAQRDEAFTRLERLGKVLYDATLAIEGELR